ncbi:MAG: OadG family protein [Oscillospiraceae bacterium]|nr:OadG family protein [Oscillospiraceae bacterium]
MTFGDACLYSVTGLLVVFFALILLMCIIKIMTTVGDAAEKKAALAAAGAAPAVAAAPTAAAEPVKEEKPGPRYTRELKLWDTDPRDAAMIMAIVAETTQIPLKELQFLSIKEIKGDNQE